MEVSSENVNASEVELDTDIKNDESPESVKPESEFNTVSSVERNDDESKMECSNESNEENSADRTAESPTTGDNNNPWSSTKCVFCKQCLNASDEPKLLECLHSACGSCIKSKISEVQSTQQDENAKQNVNTISCALCKIACRQSQIIDNRFLNEISGSDESTESNKTEDLKCNSCSDNDIATSWCVECSEFICNKCVQAHKR